MGGVGRRLLFRIRNALFNKLQELPIAFFNQNKSGDLISRINSDTDKLNQFISQALMQFIGNFFLILGTGIFMLVLHPKLALVTLIPAVGIVMITSLLSPWVKRKNKSSLESLGSLSAEVQESLSNFKVVVAFNRLDYFRQKFQDTNEKNYKKSLLSGIASTIFIPIYSLATNSASLLCLIYGLSLIGSGNLTIGLLIGFQFYVNNFYSPLRQIASVWSSFQLALASLERVREVLDMRSDLTSIPTLQMSDHTALLEFQNVSFEYATGVKIINAVNFSLEKGKTYALVGPTGGGKTTIASLMARLYDTSEGTVFLHGKDIRSYSNSERTEKIGFILQEPFLFSGSLRDNILYGNKKYEDMSEEILTTQLEKYGLSTLLKNFKE